MSKNRPISKKNLFRIKIQQNFTKLIYFHDTRRRKVAVMSTGGRKKGKGGSKEEGIAGKESARLQFEP